VAGVLVYIEREGSGSRSEASPTRGAARASLEALGEGRRIATELGAPLAAFAPAWGPDEAPQIAEVLARHGADSVLTAPSATLASSADWRAHWLPLCTAANQLPARLILAADTPSGRNFLPRVAARISAAFTARASVERGPRGELVFTRPLFGGTYLRRLASDDIDHPVVATLCPGAYSLARGLADGARRAEFAEPTLADGAPTAGPADPADGALESASVVVVGGAGLDAAGWELVKKLAATLGGEHGATASLCRRGIAPATREVGLGGRYVSPRTYIACAASGSGEHLAAVAPDTEIVAVNNDPDAPIFRAASYGLVADAADALPRLIEAASGSTSKAVAP